MTSRQKSFTTAVWAALVLGMVGVISAGLLFPTRRALSANQSLAIGVHQSPSPTADMQLTVPAFSLIDQDGKTVTDQSLRGSVWVTQFIFTHCAGPCPMLAARFEQLQKRLDGTPVKLLSISVDPTHDSPAVLKTWGEQYHADFSRWTFLTGDEKTVYAVSRGILLGITPATADAPLTHSMKFLLIDRSGIVREMIDSSDADAIERTVSSVTALAAEPPR